MSRMMSSLVMASVAFLACGEQEARVGAREADAQASSAIIGGTQVKRGRYPWMVLIKRDQPTTLDSLSICGGTLLDATHVVTTASCATDQVPMQPLQKMHAFEFVPLAPSRLHVAKRPTSLAALTDADFIGVRRVSVHPDFHFDRINKSDLAVLELSRPIHLAAYPSIAEREEVDELIARRAKVRAIGYGTKDVADYFTASDFLMQVDVPLVSAAQCNADYAAINWPITPDLLCAGKKQGGKDTCLGDTGGALFTDVNSDEPALVGITSTSWCGEPDAPGIYTKVSEFRAYLRHCLAGYCPTVTTHPFSCWMGFDDCDHVAANGCESNIASAAQCGSCGAPACPAGQGCGVDEAAFPLTPVCAALSPIVPSLDCVYTDATGVQYAQFQAPSTNTLTVVVAAGADNHYVGSQSGVHEYFSPGLNQDVARLDARGAGSWFFRGTSVPVLANSPVCASDPRNP